MPNKILEMDFLSNVLNYTFGTTLVASIYLNLTTIFSVASYNEYVLAVVYTTTAALGIVKLAQLLYRGATWIYKKLKLVYDKVKGKTKVKKK